MARDSLCAERFPGDRNDLDSAILEGFLQALDVADARARKVYGQLYWATFRRGHELCNSERAMTRSELADVADLRSEAATRTSSWPAPCSPASSRRSRPTSFPMSFSTAAKRHGMSRQQVASELTTASRHIADYLLDGPLRPAA